MKSFRLLIYQLWYRVRGILLKQRIRRFEGKHDCNATVCEGCRTIFDMDGPGVMLTEDACWLCPACVPEMIAAAKEYEAAYGADG